MHLVLHRALGARWLVVGILGLGFAGACSDSANTPTVALPPDASSAEAASFDGSLAVMGAVARDGGTASDVQAQYGSPLGDASGDRSVPLDATVEVLACPPGDVSGFVPVWTVPEPLHADRCFGAQDVLASAACIARGQYCPQSTAACRLCMAQVELSPPWYTAATRPLVGDATYTDLWMNNGACVARLVNDTSPNGCGAKIAAAQECSSYACDATCPITDLSSIDARAACRAAALAGPCAVHAQAAAPCAASLLQEGGAAHPCNSSDGLEAYAGRMGNLFCRP